MKRNNPSIAKVAANKINAKKGGVKTEEGRRVSSLNSLKHGCLSGRVLAEEQERFELLCSELSSELTPVTLLDKVLLERIAIHILQLDRISVAKGEFIRSHQNPGKYEDFLEDLLPDKICIEEPYIPKIHQKEVERLLNLYHRYEVSTENRLYRAIREYRQIKGV